jgi:type I restriction enzyme M protein
VVRAYPAGPLARDRVNLDIVRLRDEPLEDTASLPAANVLATEIMEDLQAALEQFGRVVGELNEPTEL